MFLLFADEEIFLFGYNLAKLQLSARLFAGRMFGRPGARLGTRAGILELGRAFGHAGGHFGAQARILALGRAFRHARGHFGARARV